MISQYYDTALTIRSFAHEIRIAITIALHEHGEMAVSELVDLLGIPQPKVSHHLSILRSAHLITSRRDGRSIRYSLLQKPAQWFGDGGVTTLTFAIANISVTLELIRE
jgi:DNA-binding transcriptional ArsR family regulator